MGRGGGIHGGQEAEAGGKALADAGYTFDVAHTSLLTRAHKTLGKCLEAIKQTDLPSLETRLTSKLPVTASEILKRCG